MSLTLSSPITEVNGIGPAKAKLLEKIRIHYVRDLLYTFPRRYDDFSNITPIAELKFDQKQTVRGKVRSTKSEWGWRGRRRLLRLFVKIADDSGQLEVIWYNMRFLDKQLWLGRDVYVAGIPKKGKKQLNTSEAVLPLTMHSPAIEFSAQIHDPTHTARIIPIYPETYGVTSRFLRYHIKALLPLISRLPEYIPADIRQRNQLMDIHPALQQVHFPDSQDLLDQAQRRLRFDELFFLQLAALTRRRAQQQEQAIPLTISVADRKKAIDRLPFALTKAQQRALDDVFTDLTRDQPMNRLLQGDVGSGKSAVAVMAAQTVIRAGYKVLYLAPTEILARQQVQYFQEIIGTKKTALLVGATPPAEKKIIKQRLLTSSPVCVIGTHALLQEDVRASALALSIIDEQHRFGVAQRHALRHLQEKIVPHLLSMTATPIPRTLNLTVYGDLDVSVLDELPPGRQPISTSIITDGERPAMVAQTRQQLHHGRQVYVIAPLVEDSPKLQIKSAVTTEKEIKRLFPEVAIGLVHGQMSSADKESVMRHFQVGAIQILVATAVVEVGVNVPNATVMIIEGAERFGLAQLHQLRGRIGRGEQASFCYLVPTTEAGADSQRLFVLTTTADGFKIAEEDLRLRGPGEIYGLEQSGFADLKVASLLDYPTIRLARQEAEQILDQDPPLNTYPILQAKVRQKNWITHFE